MGEPRQYWDVTFSKTESDEEVAKLGLIDRLREAIDIRMISEVPLGAFLSGGVDSSSVVAMMANLSTEAVNTCSISFGDPQFNEAPYADQVAKRYHTNHYMDQVSPDDYDLLDTLARVYDEPFADSSAIPTYRVCQLARNHVTVALSGDGGDENLAGYRRYRFHISEERLRSILPLGLRRPLFETLSRLYPKADWAPRIFRAKATFQALARDSIEGYFHGIAVVNDDLRAGLFSDKLKGELQGYHAINVLRRHEKCAPDHPLSKVQYLDLKTYLPGDILTKVDRASMAHALEVRVPILDHLLVEWMATLDPQLKLCGGEGKHIFKKALGAYLPESILYRRKMGFAVPLANWFRGPLKQRVRDAVLGEILAGTGYFDQTFLRRLVDDHQAGKRDYSAPLWSLLMFEAFLRQLQQIPRAAQITGGEANAVVGQR